MELCDHREATSAAEEEEEPRASVVEDVAATLRSETTAAVRPTMNGRMQQQRGRVVSESV